MKLYLPHFLKRRPHREFLQDCYPPQKSTFRRWLERLLIILSTLAFLAALLLLSNKSFASNKIDNTLITLNEVSRGSLLIQTDTQDKYINSPLLHTDADIKVSGMIARSRLKQTFKNTSNHWVEAIYVFPLPETAAVDHLRMLIGERIIEGEIKEKQQAKKMYEAAKNAGKKTSLIEQQRPNLFTNSVANIGPGESIVIEIEYQQTLHYENNVFSLHFPMAITPRYLPQNRVAKKLAAKSVNESISFTDLNWSASKNSVSPPYVSAQKKINPVSLNIELDAGFSLQYINSRYHAITTSQVNSITHISLAQGVVPSDRDFELQWSPQINQSPKAAAFEQRVKNNHYQMLMVLPPDAGADNGQPLARDVTYIIDTSGSMYGTSLQQAKQSLLMAVDRLRLHDKFNIIQFNSITDTLFQQSKLATFENMIKAKRYIQSLQADGGTEMAPALKLALNTKREENFVHQIIFLTDGSVGNETELFNLIHQSLGNSRLFTVGIGSAPNRYFMRKAAQFGRGTFTYIGNTREINEKMDRLFRKLESPLMTNIKVELDTPQNIEIWPKRIPDLYQGEPLILAIKSAQALDKIKLTGSRALAPWSASVNLSVKQPSPGIATFWARKKIASLMDNLNENKNSVLIRQQIINVALEHHLVSRFTSLVGVDKTPTRNLDNTLSKQQLALNLPYGQTQHLSLGRLAQTATPAKLNLIFGSSLVLLSLALFILLRRPFLKA